MPKTMDFMLKTVDFMPKTVDFMLKIMNFARRVLCDPAGPQHGCSVHESKPEWSSTGRAQLRSRTAVLLGMRGERGLGLELGARAEI